MVKRVATLCLLIMITAAFLPVVLAQGDEIRIEQVQAELPEIHAYFYGAQGDAVQTAAAQLNKSELELVSIQRADAIVPTHYFFLVDCSTSIRSSQMQSIRHALSDFTAKQDENDSVTLITFGLGVNVVLDGEKSSEKIEEAINGLKADQGGTVFFDALAKAIELSSKKEPLTRRVAFVFSDSVDVNIGGYTQAEINTLLGNEGLPFYALGFDTGKKAELDAFGAIARTSGGTISIVSDKTLPDIFAGLTDDIRAAYIAKFSAKNNIINAPQQEFSLTINGGSPVYRTVPLRYYKSDTIAPEIIAVSQQTDETIFITFSENVQNANKVESYVIRNENGDLVGIRAAAYDDGVCAATLTLSDAAFEGNITIECPGVTDISMEENHVADPETLLFKGTEAQQTPVPPAETIIIREEQPVEDGLPGGAWAIITIIAVIIIAAIILSIIKKRGGVVVNDGKIHYADAVEVEKQLADTPKVQVHFVQAELPVIEFHVTGAMGDTNRVEVPINKSLFVGRSDMCDVYFDDPDLSRQHFVIEENDGAYTVTNLSQTNGTLLNGVRIENPRPLQDGDAIEAGQLRLVFYRRARK
ncbi:FHA domain-containing protein [Christensenellaceae bacterium OttesenSCG-928-M15]|nr:FHA domain-containing protein [Christensenellaceae bacterium OttesenSCG-928-M15]